MATTASLLKAGPVFMPWKHHQQFCSRQISSNNNFFSLKKKSDHLNNPRNHIELRLVRVSSSNLRSELGRNYSKAGSSNLHDLKKLVCSSNNNLFGDDDDVGSMSVLIVEKLSRKLLAGLLLMMMAMALALRSRDSAFAASNGRMGGSISSSSSPSRSSSISSSSSPSWSTSYSPSPSSSYSGSSSCCCHVSAEAAEKAKKAEAAGGCFGIIFFFLLFIYIFFIYPYGPRKHSEGSVLMLQVGILDKKRVLQRKLNTIAESADTSTSRGLSKLLDEVSYALLQHHDSCHFVYFWDRINPSMEDSLMPFYRQLKTTERKRYDRETFMNVDGVKLERPSAIEVNSIDNEYSVVTVLVVARGRYVIPSLMLDDTLRTLYNIPRRKIKAVEVLWSPQSEGDTISEQELRRDFPHMSSCYDKKKRIPQKWWKWLLAVLGI